MHQEQENFERFDKFAFQTHRIDPSQTQLKKDRKRYRFHSTQKRRMSSFPSGHAQHTLYNLLAVQKKD